MKRLSFIIYFVSHQIRCQNYIFNSPSHGCKDLVYLYEEFVALVVNNTFSVRSICYCWNGWVPLIHRISGNSVRMAENLEFILSVKSLFKRLSASDLTVWWKIYCCSTQENEYPSIYSSLRKRLWNNTIFHRSIFIIL